MLVSHRRIDAADLGASLSTDAFVGETYRVHVVRNRAVVCEDDLVLGTLDRRGAVGRPVLTVLLEGHARIRIDAGEPHWLEPGDAIVVPRKLGVRMRQQGESYRSVALEWDPHALGAPPATVSRARFAPGTLARLTRLTDASSGARDDDPTGAAFVDELFARVRSEGLRIDAPDTSVHASPTSPLDRRLSRALDAMLSNLASQPMVVDFERALAISPRHLSRVVAVFNARFGFNADGWRDTLLRRRLTVGAALMCAPGASVDRVSHALGYSSAAAMSHTFARAGLPSPGNVASAVRLGT